MGGFALEESQPTVGKEWLFGQNALSDVVETLSDVVDKAFYPRNSLSDVVETHFPW